MTASAPIQILFDSEDTANFLVAGVPAAVRAARTEAIKDDPAFVIIAVPGGWTPSRLCMAEISRLAPNLNWEASDNQRGDTNSDPVDVTALQREAKRIIAATGKAGDGIVSRHINRPISQSISRVLLRWSGARPWHATLVAALTGLAMFAALLTGEANGLIAGAILFQLASIIDGVDGEVARATFRSSDRGAMMDSVTDAATNLGFIGGVSYNLYSSGAEQAGLAGAFGGAILALGSALLARQSKRDGGPFTFDALKSRIRERPSPFKHWLIYITMRDFYALAACVAILAGAAAPLLYIFALVATGWFIVLCWTLLVSRR